MQDLKPRSTGEKSKERRGVKGPISEAPVRVELREYASDKRWKFPLRERTVYAEREGSETCCVPMSTQGGDLLQMRVCIREQLQATMLEELGVHM